MQIETIFYTNLHLKGRLHMQFTDEMMTEEAQLTSLDYIP